MKVLFIGNSHTYFNDMPELFARIAEKTTGEKPEVTMLAYSGRELEWHGNEYFSVRFALTYGGYDFCVIQQAAHPFPPVESTAKYFGMLAGMCKKNGTVPVLFMPWAQKEAPEKQQIMIDVCEKLAGENSAKLAPIGRIWQRVLREYPDIELYYEDGGHAGVYGDFLIAALMCKVIFGKASPDAGGYGFDFKVDFGDGTEPPSAIEDKEKIPCLLDKDKTDRILKIINEI